METIHIFCYNQSSLRLTCAIIAQPKPQVLLALNPLNHPSLNCLTHLNACVTIFKHDLSIMLELLIFFWRSRLVRPRACDWKSHRRHKRLESSNLSSSAKNRYRRLIQYIYLRYRFFILQNTRIAGAKEINPELANELSGFVIARY